MHGPNVRCLATHAHCVVANFPKYCAICNDSMIPNFGTDLQTSQFTEKKERERKQNHTDVKWCGYGSIMKRCAAPSPLYCLKTTPINIYIVLRTMSAVGDLNCFCSVSRGLDPVLFLNACLMNTDQLFILSPGHCLASYSGEKPHSSTSTVWSLNRPGDLVQTSAERNMVFWVVKPSSAERARRFGKPISSIFSIESGRFLSSL